MFTNPVRRPRNPEWAPHPIPTGDLRLVLADDLTDRERAMVLLAAYGGLRRMEVARFRGEHLDLGGLMRVKGKGGRTEVIAAHPLIVSHAAVMPVAGWWFPAPSHPESPTSPQQVWTELVRCMARSGVTATPHDLRHWTATALTRSGVPLSTVARQMRHRNVATTMRYIATDASELQAAVGVLPRWDAA